MKKIVLSLVVLFCYVATINAQGFGNRVLINDEWHFNLGDIKYGGKEYLDCKGWDVVNLPHDWTVKQNASPDLASCTGYLPGGIGWYRKEITFPKVNKDKKVYLYFEGVYNNSEVFINGKWIGKRPNGYISFMYELTPYLKWGEVNTIAVRVDHSNDADSRWYTGSGIYRDVYLVYANPVHINLWGVSSHTELLGNKANVYVNTEIKNCTEAASVKVVCELYDQQNTKVGSSFVSGTATANNETGFSQKIELQNPSLWGLESPYLYTLKTTVYTGSEIVDQSDIKIGIRDVKFDCDKGLFLNGENIKVKGVCVHHDAGVLGAAVPKSVWRYRLEKLKSLGCNAIRTSHNPQAPCLYDLCDEMGFLVMAEAFDEWEYPKNKWITGWNLGIPEHQGSSEYFREWGARDLRDMIMRDRNHTSVIMWSIGNEVDYPNDPYSHPVLDEEGISQHHVIGYKPERPRAERLGEIAKELVKVVKQADTSRPVTAALAGAVMSNNTEYPFALDVVGYNYTESRYDLDHKKYPKRILYGSENRHDLSAWHAVRDKPFIFGQFLWSGFDYLGEAGAWPARAFVAGLVDLAGNVKPRGYFRKSLWYNEPMAYLGTYLPDSTELSIDAPHVWNYEKDDLVRVVCYTNCDEAELCLNGNVVGALKKYDDDAGMIYWDVNYEKGELKVMAYNRGTLATSDSILSNTSPCKMVAEVIEPKDNALERLVVVSLLDDKNKLVALGDNEITCTVSDGILLGLENGSNVVSDNFLDNKQRCINGKLMVYLKKDNGNSTMKLKLSASLLDPLYVDVY